MRKKLFVLGVGFAMCMALQVSVSSCAYEEVFSEHDLQVMEAIKKNQALSDEFEKYIRPQRERSLKEFWGMIYPTMYYELYVENLFLIDGQSGAIVVDVYDTNNKELHDEAMKYLNRYMNPGSTNYYDLNQRTWKFDKTTEKVTIWGSEQKYTKKTFYPVTGGSDATLNLVYMQFEKLHLELLYEGSCPVLPLGWLEDKHLYLMSNRSYEMSNSFTMPLLASEVKKHVDSGDYEPYLTTYNGQKVTAYKIGHNLYITWGNTYKYIGSDNSNGAISSISSAQFLFVFKVPDYIKITPKD